MKRHSTRADMVRKLTALERNTQFAADVARGFAAGLVAAGLSSEHTDAAIHTDDGRWDVDSDGRRVWRVLP